MKPVITFFDIETGPLKISSWSTWEATALRVEEDWELLSFAYKKNEGKTKVLSLNQFKNEKDFVKELWKLFDESDILVAHNGDSFDIKKSQAKFAQYGLLPPSPFKTIDTLKIAKSSFKFTSNRLDALGELLGVGRKVKHNGIDLWFGCLDGDEKSYKLMRRYNKQDVDLLYAVYQRLKPYMKSHPNLAIYEGILGCGTCKSTNIQLRGFGYNKSSYYRRFQCKDCGSWGKGDPIKRDKKDPYFIAKNALDKLMEP